ncbi:MFS transporter [Nocardioides humilatus]|uniref:MFS transporter n=1 Tax=Nocardioides humilatus TaxID=2607660 RepID=A0A5B1L618_9ACTN|nr:MFS transporter [Nocardioides humilatus]KAA1415964.1 MFS transporter [Nocardioides humilatus]
MTKLDVPIANPAVPWPRRLLRRELDHYPTFGPRVVSLSIVVLTTVLFYYQYYVISSVSTAVLRETGMSFLFFVGINVVSVVASAITSLAAGITDKYGRANVIVWGVLGCALVCVFGISNAHTTMSVAVWYTVLGALEGVVLVATPALVRDFSPQLGRASAMGFWTLGPVLGSLIATAVVSNTSDHLANWQDQYVIAGVAGLAVFVVALLGLRELSPELRDQIIVSDKDRALIEARAKGIDVEAAVKNPVKQLMRLDILGSAIAISLFLFIYFVAVSFFPLMFQTVFGYSESRANSVTSWMWAFQAGSLIVVGLLSDKLRVRKPFMLVGGVGAVISTIVMIDVTGDPTTSYTTFAVVMSAMAVCIALVFAPWMASYTETVESHNPALTATGLSVWGFTIRLIAGVAVFLGPAMVTSATTLVTDGEQAAALAARYEAELGTAAKIDPAVQDALAENPDDQAAQVAALSQVSGLEPAVVAKAVELSTTQGDALAAGQALSPDTASALLADPTDPAAGAAAVGEVTTALGITPEEAMQRLQALAQIPPADLGLIMQNGPAVQAAAAQLTALGAVPADDIALLTKVDEALKDAPGQWQNYFWFAVGGEILFIPLIFIMAGAWSPRRARELEEEHEALVAAELAKLAGAAS